MDTRIPPLIPALDAAVLRGRPDVVIVDARGGADAFERYRQEHLQDAVFLDLETDLSHKSGDPAKGGRHPLPDAPEFGARLGKAGITPATHVLVYDDKSGANAAARLWWMMLSLGHRSVQVVDGGLTSMREAGLPLAMGQQPPASIARVYPASQWQLPLADIELVDKSRSSNGSLIIDVREGYRYRGESEPIDEIAGHIPGAVNIPYTGNLQPDGRFLPAHDLRKKYESVTGGRKDVIVHCGSGVTACHTLLAMASAGIHGTRLYVGSWSEWSRNPKPVATGANP